MNQALIDIQNITKYYNKRITLNDLSFTVHKGEICGLVGENGAGKTTLIRIIAGLIKSDGGVIDKSKIKNLSCIIESPAFYPNLSAYDNLKYHMLRLGFPKSNKKIDEILNLVGLKSVERNKKVKNFSLGMKQRLAIGLSIIDSPQLLILDEPINGLDPVGIKEMRELLLNLKKNYNMTILISSHILSELELVVDRYIILHKGKIIQNITKASIQRYLSSKIILEVDNVDDCYRLLNKNNYSCRIVSNRIEIYSSTDSINNIVQGIIEENLVIYGIYSRKTSFEEYYMALLQERKLMNV